MKKVKDGEPGGTRSLRVIGDCICKDTTKQIPGCCRISEQAMIGKASLLALGFGTKGTELGGVAMAACGNRDIGFLFFARQGLNGSFCGSLLC